MPKECKKYRMRSTRKPLRDPCLSSTVKVIDQGGNAGYCYVGFDAPLVAAVGKKLSRGVADYDPAYLTVEYDQTRQRWVVGARYLLTDESVVLWETVNRPEWVKQVYLGGRHGGNQENKNCGPARSSDRGTSQDCPEAALDCAAPEACTAD